jgi:5-methylcytosine-specific restriction endonuclease McrA
VSKLRGQPRTEFPQPVRKAAFARACKDGKPHCEKCGKFIRAGHLIFEHLIPDGLGGEPTLENCGVYCRPCADIKTVEEDNPRMNKADRVLKRAYGLGKRRRTIPGRRFNGDPIPSKWVNS